MIEKGHNSPLRAVGELCPFGLFGMIISIWFMISLLNNKHFTMLYLSEDMTYQSIWLRFLTPAACSGCLMFKGWHFGMVQIKHQTVGWIIFYDMTMLILSEWRRKMPCFFKGGAGDWSSCTAEFFVPLKFLWKKIAKGTCQIEMYVLYSLSQYKKRFWILLPSRLDIGGYENIGCFFLAK